MNTAAVSTAGRAPHGWSVGTAGLATVWALLWAGAFLATQIALRDAGPAAVVGARCALAGLVLLALRIRLLHTLSPRSLLALGLLGLLNNIGYLLVMAWALPHLSVGMAAVLSACTPLLVQLGSAALGDARLSGTRLLGLLLGFGGIVVSALDRLGAGVITAAGIAAGAVAVGFLVVATVCTPRLVGDIDPYLATGWQALVGGVPMVVFAVLSGGTVDFGPALAGAVLFLALGASVIGMSLWLLLIRRAGPAGASVAQFMPPLFGVALGALVLGEEVTVVEIAAVVPVAAGIVLATRRPAAATAERLGAVTTERLAAGTTGRSAAGTTGRLAAGTTGRSAAGTTGRSAAGTTGRSAAATTGRPAAAQPSSGRTSSGSRHPEESS
ncbi:DMT family transporter [Nocardia sp. NPDC024068]|uniref:DMT family transporter n=1 Tax=Nocardia sp. NPDC024068 TaxID=3157197 RepID=UPI003404BA52